MSMNMMRRFGGAMSEDEAKETFGQQLAAGLKAELQAMALEEEDNGEITAAATPSTNASEATIVVTDVQPSAREQWDEDVGQDEDGVEATRLETTVATPPSPAQARKDNMTFAVTRRMPGMPQEGAASVEAGSLLWVALEDRVAHPESVEALLASAAGIDTSLSGKAAALSLDKVHINGETALHSMIRSGDLQWCDKLVLAGCSTEIKGPYGYTAAHYAVQYGQADILTSLINHGANLRAVTPVVGQSPLHIAAREGSVRCAQIILGVNGNRQQTNTAETAATETVATPASAEPETAATPSPPEAAAAAAAAAGATAGVAAIPSPPTATAGSTDTAQTTTIKVDPVDVNGVDTHWGWTPLHYAAMYAHPGVITLLAEHGASSTIQDSKGYTPLHMAAENADHATVSTLASMPDAPFNLSSVGMFALLPSAGWSPFDLACNRENLLDQTNGVGGNIGGNRVKPIPPPPPPSSSDGPQLHQPTLSGIITEAADAATMRYYHEKVQLSEAKK